MITWQSVLVIFGSAIVLAVPLAWAITRIQRRHRFNKLVEAIENPRRPLRDLAGDFTAELPPTMKRKPRKAKP